MKQQARWLVAPLLALAWASEAAAHLNSPDIFLEEQAGPYSVIVIVHMPPAVPGEAEVQVRIQDPRPGETFTVDVLEIPPQGEEHAPGWIPARPSEIDPMFFTTSAPLMTYGFWRFRARVTGPRGEGSVEVPVSAQMAKPKEMPLAISSTLGALMLLFLASYWQIMVGLGRDAHRPMSAQLTAADRRRGRRFAVGAAGFLVFLLSFIGYFWFRHHQRYESLGGPQLRSELTALAGPAVSGTPLRLGLEIKNRRDKLLDDIRQDNGKDMHLVIVKMPELSYLVHIHPEQEDPGRFTFDFTPPVPGTYAFFADILRRSGIVETVSNELVVEPGETLRDVSIDDPDASQAYLPPMSPVPVPDPRYDLGGGLTMVWTSSGPLVPGEFARLTFEIVDETGKVVRPVEPYLGSPAHLTLIRSDAKVFARLRPVGVATAIGTDDAAPAAVAFPYSFPFAGNYRMWVQMKYGGRIHSGVFDVAVE